MGLKPHGFFLSFLATFICFCVTVLLFVFCGKSNKVTKLQKLQNGQRITLKIRHLNKTYIWARDTFMWHWSADTFFDSCHLTITWMSNTKLNKDGICLGLQASKRAFLHPLTWRGTRFFLGRIDSQISYQWCSAACASRVQAPLSRSFISAVNVFKIHNSLIACSPMLKDHLDRPQESRNILWFFVRFII